MFKKIFSGVVSATTIAWSVGAGALALPTVASAATAGDLIKASGPAVYYFHTDGKRYVFPNEKTYFSWFKDFSSVKTISDSELASIFVGGNVTVRPGTYLAKVTTDPKVYAVSHDGKFHWIESEAIAKALYGDNWAQRVIDVPDAFFVNYTVGTSLSTAVHPDGTVVSKDGSKWVIASGKARKIVDDSVFAANGYNAAFTIPTTIAYTADTNVTAREGRLADVIYGAGTPIGGNVSVALASDTPAGMTVPKNATSVPLSKFNFTAGSSDALVTGLRLRRVGVGAASDLSGVYVYDANGARLTTGRTVNSTTNEVEFNNLNISIPAGQTKSLVVVGDFALAPSAATGGQHSFQLINAASVISTGVVSGAFPVAGNVFTVGTISAGRLDVVKGTLPVNPNLGTTDAEISNFKLIANTNDIEVRRITLLQAGSISNSDLSNFKLTSGGAVVATAAAMTGDKIVLNFTAPFTITNGTTKSFSLTANVAGRTGRTIRTFVEYSTDVYAVDKLYNSGASVCTTAAGACTTGTFDGVENVPAPGDKNYIEVTTQGGSLTIAYNGPATQNLAKGSQDVTLFKYSITNSDSDVEIRNIRFMLDGGVNMVKGSNGTEYFRDIKVKNLDTGATVMGPTSLPVSTPNGATSANITLSDTFTLQAGKTLNLAITADLANNEDALNEFFTDGNNAYSIKLGNGGNIFSSNDVRIISTSEYLPIAKIIPNSTINGNLMTIKASSLTVALAATPSAAVAVKKQSMIPAAGFVFSAGSQSDVTVRAVKLSGLGDTTGVFVNTNFAQVVTACDLYNGDTKVGTSQAIDSTTGEVQISNMNLAVAKGTSVTLVAKCTADSTITQVGGDRFSVGIAAAVNVVAEDADGNIVTPVTFPINAAPTVAQTVKDGGLITIASDNLRQSTILVADGTTWQNVASYKATAQYEAAKIERVRVTLPAGIESASFAGIAVAFNGSVVGQDTLPAGNAGVSKDIDLSTPIMVPKDGSTTFQVWAKVAAVQSVNSVPGAGIARSGAPLQAGIEYNVQNGNWDAAYNGKLNVRLIGEASGDVLRANAAMNAVGNEFIARKTKPTITRQALVTSTLTNGSDKDLHKFQVSADAAGAVALKEVTFNVSYSGATALSNFRLKKGSNVMNVADVRIQDETGADLSNTTLGNNQVIVTFVNEETISGSGVVYTLVATVAGSLAGDQVSIDFARDTVNGTLTDVITDLPGTTGVQIGGVDGFFVWSDNSEIPHSYATPGSSADWINDVYLEDLQGTSLSR